MYVYVYIYRQHQPTTRRDEETIDSSGLLLLLRRGRHGREPNSPLLWRWHASYSACSEKQKSELRRACGSACACRSSCGSCGGSGSSGLNLSFGFGEAEERSRSRGEIEIRMHIICSRPTSVSKWLAMCRLLVSLREELSGLSIVVVEEDGKDDARRTSLLHVR